VKAKLLLVVDSLVSSLQYPVVNYHLTTYYGILALKYKRREEKKSTLVDKRTQTIKQFAEVFGCPAPWFVGVLNATPDSFSDGGSYITPKQALSHGEKLIEDGAHLVDIGGEATGPSSSVVDADEELRRIEPLVRSLSADVFVSIDTYKAKTARRCLELGARMINDISALRADREMVAVVRDFDCYLVLMHSKEEGLPHVTSKAKLYDDIISEVCEFLLERIDYALQNGIRLERIIVDPGMGKFLSPDDNYSWELLRRFDELLQRNEIPCPLLVATSRKGFLGGPITARDPISQLTALSAYEKGASFIRTHNVRMARDFFAAWRRLSCV